jgi:hypothetical protein
MKFPQLHLFVDIHCPALISGQLSSWMKPAQLIAMIRPQNQQLSPPGAEAARHIRRWRSRHTAKPQEVQVIIAGDPWPSLYKGLGTHLKDSIRFENTQSMVRADLYKQMLDQATEAREALQSADIAYESFVESFELLEPNLLHEAQSLVHELESLTEPGKPSWMTATLDTLAQQFEDRRNPSSTLSKKAA